MTTPLAIIVPVKPPHEGKSRLAGELSSHRRYLLNWRLLRHTFDQVAMLSDIADVRVISRSPDVLAEALRRGFATSREPARSDLNGAVALGAQHSQSAGARELMILPIDLPWLSAARLRSAVAEFRAGHDVLIVADRRADGTNLLLWRPLETARFHYGAASASRHAEAARAQGLRVAVRDDPLLSFDVDTPQDLAIWSPGDLFDLKRGRRLAG
jgi:2-phospho-L-lactate/phosphoenolpyruvate guanylyltransferase